MVVATTPTVLAAAAAAYVCALALSVGLGLGLGATKPATATQAVAQKRQPSVGSPPPRVRSASPSPSPAPCTWATWHYPDCTPTTSTINGIVPPGNVTLINSTLLFNEDDGFGGRVIAFLDTRPNGTRSPYHTHPYGGQTCVKSGYATPYEEGMEPMTYGPGECYWMHANTPMAGTAQSGEPAVIFDSFHLPPGVYNSTQDLWSQVWHVVEANVDVNALIAAKYGLPFVLGNPPGFGLDEKYATSMM